MGSTQRFGSDPRIHCEEVTMQPSQQAKVAVVTGAAQGIGRATAERLATEGFTVIVVDRTAEGVEVTRAAINAAGGHAVCEVVDLARREERDALVPRVIERYGGLDALVNNAAFTGRRA